MSLILSRRDLDFLLFEWLGTERLFERPRFAGQGPDVYVAGLCPGPRRGPRSAPRADRPPLGRAAPPGPSAAAGTTGR